MSHRSTILYLNNARYYDSIAVMVAGLRERCECIDDELIDIDTSLRNNGLNASRRMELEHKRLVLEHKRRDICARLDEYGAGVL